MDSLEIASHTCSKGFDKHGLSRSGNVLEKNMAAREKRNADHIDRIALTDDDLADIFLDSVVYACNDFDVCHISLRLFRDLYCAREHSCARFGELFGAFLAESGYDLLYGLCDVLFVGVKACADSDDLALIYP